MDAPGGPPRRGFWRRRSGRILLIALIVLAVFVVVSFTAARFTESNRFCGTDCHEMWPYRDTWAASSHRSVDCVRCHIPAGTINFIETKLAATREVWVHVTGQVKAPIKVTRHIPDSVCQGCHSDVQLGQPIALGSPAPVTFRHDRHSARRCIACHAGVVHQGAPGVHDLPPNSMASCLSCHTDGTTHCDYCHRAPHAARGPCRDCHGLASWTKDFTHPQPLTGRHAQIACERCHTQTPPDGCVDCHGDHHNGLDDCVRCHVLAHWTPTTFTHPQEGPHVPAGDEPLQCDACHQRGFGQPAGCPCHGGNPPTGD